MSEDVDRRAFLRLTGLAGVTAVIGPGLLEACGGSTSGESTLDRARKAGTIRVGFANEAPYGFADTSGKLSGEAPTVAAEIMKALGVAKLEGVLTEFGALIPGLLANRFDMIIYNGDDDSTNSEHPELHWKGRGKRQTLHFKRPGTYYISIDSRCDWRIRVLDRSQS